VKDTSSSPYGASEQMMMQTASAIKSLRCIQQIVLVSAKDEPRRLGYTIMNQDVAATCTLWLEIRNHCTQNPMIHSKSEKTLPRLLHLGWENRVSMNKVGWFFP
jgi:hypothetical protein